MKNSPKQKWSLVLNVTLAVVMLSLVTAVGATSLTAATFTVSNVNDSGVGSLRQAILEANARPGVDEITFAQLEGTITLTSGQLAITDDLSIGVASTSSGILKLFGADSSFTSDGTTTIGVAGNTNEIAMAMNSAPKMTPPMAPSTVFFGLMAGASGRRPNARPV